MAKKLVIDSEKCTGCRICEMACAVNHTGAVNPLRARIRILKWEWEGRYVPSQCRQCASPACQAACPVDAIYRDDILDRVMIDYDKCIGCRACIDACPFGMIGFDPVDQQVIKCDLCGGDPQCVRFCDTKAIVYTDVPDPETASLSSGHRDTAPAG